MKMIFASVGLIAAFIFAGCGDGSKAPATAAPAAPAAASSSAPAPVQYIADSVNAEKGMMKTIDATSLNENVQLFNVQEGRLPKDLQELVTKGYYKKLPEAPPGMKIVYDAVSGKVTVVKQ